MSQFETRIAKAIRLGDITSNGVAYEWSLSGPNGASFTLLRQSNHTDEDISEAKRILRNNRDVTSIKIERK